MAKDTDEKKPPVDPRYRGPKTYVSTKPFYHQGHYYGAGVPFTVTDMVPGKDWTLVEATAPATAKATARADVPVGRPSDRDIA